MQRKNKQFVALLRIILIFLIFTSLLIAITTYISYQFAIIDAQKYLKEITQRVKEDIKYHNGQWDTTKYNADSNIPDINPLYVLSSDGFVIERWKPIAGLLDVSEFTRLLAYDQPETIQTITNENWRILSKPIKYKDRIVGVITVTAYKPEFNNLATLDEQLSSTVEKINSQLIVKGDSIDITHVDERQIPYNITFQIVNKLNKLLFHNNNTSSISRSPSFIDNSYIDMQLKQNNERMVIDEKTGKKYQILTVPLYDDDASLIGIIVAGYPIDKIYTLLLNNITIFFTSSLLLLLLLFPLLRLTIIKYREDIVTEINNNKSQVNVEKISFNKQQCKIIIDEHIITIPYASLQYYFCIALFSKPHKQWETDEILDKIGEQVQKNSWRKLYDAMTALNKKLDPVIHTKLFIVQNKTFKINPHLTSKIT